MTLKKLFYCAIVFSIFLLNGCSTSQGNEETHIEHVELSKKLVDFLDQQKLAIVLSNKGCTSCNNKIVKITDSVLVDMNVNVVIETTGRNYDISSVLKQEHSAKVIKDYQQQLSKKFNAENSYFLYLPNGIEGEGVEKHEITVANMDSYESLLKKYLAK